MTDEAAVERRGSGVVASQAFSPEFAELLSKSPPTRPEETISGALPNGAEGRRHQNWRGHRRPTEPYNPPSLILSRVVGKIESGVIDFIRKLIQGVTANLIPLLLVRQNIPESDSAMSPHPVKGDLPLIE